MLTAPRESLLFSKVVGGITLLDASLQNKRGLRRKTSLSLSQNSFFCKPNKKEYMLTKRIKKSNQL